MSDNKTREIESAFDIAKMFVEHPQLFDDYPDGTHFFIGSEGDLCKDCGESYHLSQIHVSVKSTLHSNFKII